VKQKQAGYIRWKPVRQDTCSISDFARNPAAIVRQAQQKGSVTVCRNGRVVGFLISRDRMEAILETLELMGDPDAMKAIRQYEASKARLKDVSCLDDDKG
jgi:prevent-host-death family protein